MINFAIMKILTSKTAPLTSLFKIISVVALAAVASGGSTFAAPFIPGNIVVLQEDDGSVPTSTAASPVFLLELLPSKAGQTLPVQSIAIPTNGANRLVQSSSSASEGFLTLSVNASNVTFVGYDSPVGVANVPGTPATTNRVWGQVDFNGNFTRGASGGTTAYGGSNIRASVSDGTNNFWMSGTATTAANGGIWYSANGGAWSEIVAAGGNFRVTRIFGGKLYYDSSTTLSAFTGIPTTTATATATGITGTSIYDFAINPAGTVAYVCDDSSLATVGGIAKWTNNGGAWGKAFTFGFTNNTASNNFTAGCRSIAVDFSGVNPVIYATTADTLTKIITITDTSVLGATSNSTDQATILAIAPNGNFAYRGVALAPPSSSAGTAPTITGISPTNASVSLGGTNIFTLVGSAGYPTASNLWYKISGGTTNLISGATASTLTFTNAQLSNSASYFAILTNASGSATSSVVALTVTASPTISGISPTGITNSSGFTATFTLTSSSGTPAASNSWYKITGTSAPFTTNLVAGATNTILTFSPAVVSNTANYFAILANSSGSATSAVVSLIITDAPPSITGIGPASITTNAGLNASFTVTNTGSSPFSYAWYKGTVSPGNVISGATNATLTLSNVLGGDAANYQVVITNTTGLSATSTVVSLTVTGDPHIATQPANAYGLLSNTVQFAVGVIGTAPTYQWYYADTGGNLIAPVGNGAQGDGSVIFGATSSTLTITNLQLSDVTNFVVQVSGTYGGPINSSVASLLSVAGTATLAFWDFNGPEFTNYIVNPNCVTYPAPYTGVGSATAVGSAFSPGGVYPFTATSFSPFSGSVDPNDGLGFTPHVPPFSWGTVLYPTNGNPALNKTSGAQFNISTVGAKNIKFSYESRGTGTASKYERLQYTTNGVDWVDYPSSSIFSSIIVSWYPFSYDLTGIPGVANNPNFGVRIVTEYQSTATYGVSANANFIGVANTYGTGGTLTYDLVTFTGDAITSTNQPPTISGFVNTNMVDYLPLTNNFTVGDDTTPANQLTYSAASLNPSSFNPTFDFQGSGTNRQLIIHPNSIAQTVAAAPILVTVTDTNGDSTVAWFDVTVGTVNLPPTNSLTTVSTTNMLANTSLAIPFTVGDDRTPTNGQSFSYMVTSGNTTLIPNDSVNNLIISNLNPTNLIFTIIPATNQVGLGVVSVSVNDNDLLAPKSTTATIPIMVRPNTNIVTIDYFNYDTAGALDVAAGGFWQHLSGNLGQMQVAGGVVTVDTLNNTENLQTPLLGAPYSTNGSAVLYASFNVNMANAANLPRINGTYFAAFNDASGNTANVEACVVVATNGAAPGNYRLGINNRAGATATNSQMFAMDLVQNSNYVVVVALDVHTGVSTLWINPANQASPSVTDSNPLTTKFNIGDFELRESGANGGAVSVSHFLVGTTFNSVIYPPLANPDNYTVVVDSSNNALNPLTNDLSGGTLSLVNVSPTNGTAAISGNQVLFTPDSGFIGTATIGYTIQDNLGGTNTSLITVTVTSATLIPTNPPVITGITIVNGGNLVLTGTNAQATGVYYLLTSTNVASPLSQWFVVATNVVSTTNNFTFIGTNVVIPGDQQQFYILSSTNSNHP